MYFSSRSSYSRGHSQHNPQNPKSESNFLNSRHNKWVLGLPAHVAVDVPEKVPTFIAVGGGKGGVGKSILSSNLAGKLGQSGYKVLLLDLDLGGANLHTYFGVGLPKKCLADYIIDGRFNFTDLFIETCIKNVALIAGGKDETWTDTLELTSGLFSNLWHELLYAKINHKFDFVILDLGAGAHRHTIDFFTSAHVGIVTVLPEPTSIENAYTFLKATMWRLIENAGLSVNSCAAADEIKQKLFEPIPGLKTYLDKLQFMKQQHPDLIDHILEALAGRYIGFVVNQIRTQRDIDISNSMQTISKNYFGFDSISLGYLNHDEAAWKSLRNRRLLLMDFPHSLLARRLGEVSMRLCKSIGF